VDYWRSKAAAASLAEEQKFGAATDPTSPSRGTPYPASLDLDGAAVSAVLEVSTG